MLKAYLGVASSHRATLSFGTLLAFFSSLGQTFLISLFVPHMLPASGLNAAGFAGLYSAATLAGAMLLPFLGRAIDRVPLRRYALAVSGGLIASCLVMAVADGWPSLLLGLVGLRLTGQGLLSHAASTVVARRAAGARGKALGLSGLGYPLGEALLPALVTALIHFAGWRAGWLGLAALAGVLLVPSVALLSGRAEELRPAGSPGPRLRPLSADPRFYLLLPASIVLPFVLTGVFFFQASLAQSRGWGASWLAAGLFGFSTARVAASILAGPWIDGIGASRLFPFFVAPAALGLLLLAAASSPWGLVAFLVLAGLSQGLGGALKIAVWAELYPLERLGEVRSAAAGAMVLGTAAGPALMGALLDAGWSYETLFSGAAVVAAASMALAFAACRDRASLASASSEAAA